MNEPLSAAPFSTLKKSPRMPVLFIGHGSPMNAIEDNMFRQSWQVLGLELLAKYPRPQLILCISAHWISKGWWLTAMEKPKTIHDFGGFPQELFAQLYPASGSPLSAKEISATITTPKIGLDKSEWGLDHGAWSVLKPMFPEANIPVVQLSLDYDRPPSEHFALGQQLKVLRDHGVLIIGSGNIVHNLRVARFDATNDQAYDFAIEFDKIVGEQITKGDLAALANFQALGNVAKMAQPTHDHYLPLLHAAGAVDAKEAPRFFNTNYQGASIAMRSVVWG